MIRTAFLALAFAFFAATVASFFTWRTAKAQAEAACTALILQAGQVQSKSDADAAQHANITFGQTIARIERNQADRTSALDFEIAQDEPETRPACVLGGADIEWLRNR